MNITRDQQGRLHARPEDNDPDRTLQASCKQIGKTLRGLATESAIGLIWAVLALVSVVVLLGSEAGVADFRYVGF